MQEQTDGRQDGLPIYLHYLFTFFSGAWDMLRKYERDTQMYNLNAQFNNVK